jgi:dipeptidyl aminopeptidase/acylaminoacyl peptidase
MMRFPVGAAFRTAAWLAIPLFALRLATLAQGGPSDLATLAQGGPSDVARLAQGRPADQTRLLRSPTVSATHIAFAYANNIWSVERGGGNARRLTSFQGQTSNPHYSPDGTWIAFSGEYAGNTDVYVVAADGGEPKRLTWHPGGDQVQGWTPDGQSIVFASARASWASSSRWRFPVPTRERSRLTVPTSRTA